MRNDIALYSETGGFTDNCRKRILVINDHPTGRQGLKGILAETEDLVVCGEVENGPKSIREMRRLQPDLVLLGNGSPQFESLGAVQAMLAERPNLPIVVHSIQNESFYAIRALRAGAKGFIFRGEPNANLAPALRKVLGGGYYLHPTLAQQLVLNAIRSPHGKITSSPMDTLSDRELEVLRSLGRGEGSRQIAENLHLSIKTVETHRAHIREKLGLSDGEALVRFALEWSLREGGGT